MGCKGRRLYVVVAGVWGDPSRWSVVPYRVEFVEGGRRLLWPSENERSFVGFSSTFALWRFYSGRAERGAGGECVRGELRIYGLSSLAPRLVDAGCDAGRIARLMEDCGIVCVKSYFKAYADRSVEHKWAVSVAEALPAALTQVVKREKCSFVVTLRSGDGAFELVKAAALASMVDCLLNGFRWAGCGGEVWFVVDTTHGVNYTTIAFHEASIEAARVALLLASILPGESRCTPTLRLYMYNSDPVVPPPLPPEGREFYKIHLTRMLVLEHTPVGAAQQLAVETLMASGCRGKNCIVGRLQAQLSKLGEDLLGGKVGRNEAESLVYMLAALAGGVLPWALYYAAHLHGRLPRLGRVEELVSELAQRYHSCRVRRAGIESGKEEGETAIIKLNYEIGAPEEAWALTAVYLAAALASATASTSRGVGWRDETLEVPVNVLKEYSYLLGEPAKHLLEHEVDEMESRLAGIEPGRCKPDWGREEPDLRVFLAHAGLPAKLVEACKGGEGVYVRLTPGAEKKARSFLESILGEILGGTEGTEAQVTH